MATGFTYHPMHMHLHAACDHGASMALHMHNAHALGMHYIWFTDHDTRTGTKKDSVTGFSFDSPSLQQTTAAGAPYGFRLQSDDTQYAIDPQSKQLTLRVDADVEDSWRSGGITFFSSATRHTSALAANVTLSIDLTELALPTDSRLIFDITLSQRPPALQKAHMLYVLGSTQGLQGPHTQIIPLEQVCGTITMPISEDVSQDPQIGGKDNAFDTLTITLQARNQAQAQAVLRDFRIRIEKSYEQVHQALKEVAAQVGQRYDITPFVSFEISAAGEHKNCYGTQVPTLDYQAHNYSIPVWEAAQHVRAHGGIFAFNHPFAIAPLKRKNFTPVERMQVLAKMQAELVANRAYGAHLMEVGFPMGRNGFSLEEYLLLWDMLSASGLFLCGYGSSDSHRDNTGWFEGNNFCAYIGVDAALNHPIAEKAFTDALKRGNAYTGDPTKLQGAVTFQTAGGHPMGSVFRSSDADCIRLSFSAEKTKPGWEFRLVENGRTVETRKITGESFAFQSQLKLGQTTVNFQRAELWDETGRCILLTNPIYLINTHLFAGSLPEERLVTEAPV